MKIAICFAQFGPYHHARVRALQEASEATVVPLQLADATCTYAWESHVNPCDGLRTLCEGHYEKLSPLRVFFRAFRFFRHETISAALLPSYAPASETALFLAAKFAGVRCVMMNESHAGTEQAKGFKKWLKRRLIRRFDSALVGGTPQKRHFTQLGLPEHAIFTGYDAIDNSYFEDQAARIRSNPSGPRIQLGLPDRYFLSLGRMVKKKNLPCLLKAYACFADKMIQQADTVSIPALVFVGSGPEEDTLRRQCEHLSLNLIDAVALTYSSDFRSASGVLNVNAQFKKPVLVSCGPSPLKKVVQKYHLGPWVEPDSSTEIERGLEQLVSRPRWPGAEWEAYIKDHSWEENARRVVEAMEHFDPEN